IGELANSNTSFIGIRRVIKTYSCVLAEWRCVRYYQAAILATRYLVDPASQASQTACQSFFGEYRYLCEGRNAEVAQMGYHFSHSHRIDMFTLALDLRRLGRVS